jgi:hypothetical protein
MLHLVHKLEVDMYEFDEECGSYGNYEYERWGIYDLSDVLTQEEIEEIRQQKEDEHYNSPVSMESLGLSWRDFA